MQIRIQQKRLVFKAPVNEIVRDFSLEIYKEWELYCLVQQHSIKINERVIVNQIRPIPYNKMEILYLLIICVVSGLTMTNVQAQCNQATCTAFTNITTCLGIITVDHGFAGTGYNTGQGSISSEGLTCGSQQPGLQTHLFQFEVNMPGLYIIQTLNIGDGDPTMQVATCSGEIVGCNDEADNTTHNARLELALQPGISYIASVTKYDSYEDEVNFDLQIIPQCVSTTLTPSQCFGTKGEPDLVVSDLDLKGAKEQLVLPCGSKMSGLDDFVFRFQVETDGVFSISTNNIGDSDTTMAIYDEFNELLGCNDDVGVPANLQASRASLANDDEQSLTAIVLAGVRSEVVVRLNASVQYVGVVSKFDKNTADLKFDVVIKPGKLPGDAPEPTGTPGDDGVLIGTIVGAVSATLFVTALILAVIVKKRASSSSGTKETDKDIPVATFNRSTGQFEYDWRRQSVPHEKDIPVESFNRRTGQFEYDWRRQSIALGEEYPESDNPLFAPHPLMVRASHSENPE
jgi:hypothetical protein